MYIYPSMDIYSVDQAGLRDLPASASQVQKVYTTTALKIDHNLEICILH